MTVDFQLADLRGASVFITGGGSGIGAAITEAFLAQGAEVAFVDITDSRVFCDDMEQRYSKAPLFIKCDIADIGALKQAVQEAEAKLGAITVLVNNAARDDRHSLSSLSQGQWDDSIAVNLRPHFFSAQAVVDSMRQQGGGSIINVSSNAVMLGLAGYPAYVAAKAGIAGLTKALATELGPDNIRVNSLAPGWVMTQRQESLWVTDEALDECLSQQCLKKLIQPSDIAATVLFLASSMSSMMTGQMLVVDGGRV